MKASDLPVELWGEVISFLSWNENFKCQQVSSTWKEAACHATIAKFVIESDKLPTVLRQPKLSPCPSSNCSIQKVPAGFAQRVQSLSISLHSDMESNVLWDCIANFTNLQVLKFHVHLTKSSHPTKLPKLPSLKHLSLRATFAKLADIPTSFPSLEVLDCVGNDQLVGNILELKPLKTLTVCRLRRCTNIVGDFKAMDDMPNMRELMLRTTRITRKDISGGKHQARLDQPSSFCQVTQLEQIYVSR